MQVPETLLKEMSTDNLIITCINYPAFGHYTAYPNAIIGIEQVISNFNGLQELMKRNDAPTKMVGIYTAIDSTMNISNKLIDNQHWAIRCTYFEYLLSVDDILDKMSDTDKVQLLKEAQKKLWIKMDNQTEYSTDSYRPTLLTMAKILVELDSISFENNDKLSEFIKSGFLDELTAKLIIDSTDKYLK